MNKNTRTTIIVIVVIVVALLGYLAWQERQGTAVPVATATSTVSSISTSTGVTVTSSTSTITTVAPSASAAPNYKTPLTFPAGMDAAEEAQDQSQFATVQTMLASSPTNYSAWLELGLLREDAGQYAEAAADWNYVAKLYPSEPTAFADLGDIYANHLGETSEGITEYKEAIKLDPTHEVTFYQNLARIYLSEGDNADAKTILQEGISAQVSGYQSLQTQLNSMQ